MAARLWLYVKACSPNYVTDLRSMVFVAGGTEFCKRLQRPRRRAASWRWPTSETSPRLQLAKREVKPSMAHEFFFVGKPLLCLFSELALETKACDATGLASMPTRIKESISTNILDLPQSDDEVAGRHPRTK
jgi:hypothetical protein